MAKHNSKNNKQWRRPPPPPPPLIDGEVVPPTPPPPPSPPRLPGSGGGRLPFIQRLLALAKGKTGMIGLGVGATAALGGGLIAKDYYDDEKERKQREDRFNAWIEERANARRRAYEQQSLEHSILSNEKILAQVAPHEHMQLMAGRRLPVGAVTLGGSPRHDLVRELAMAMSEGGLPAGGLDRERQALQFLAGMQRG